MRSTGTNGPCLLIFQFIWPNVYVLPDCGRTESPIGALPGLADPVYLSGPPAPLSSSISKPRRGPHPLLKVVRRKLGNSQRLLAFHRTGFRLKGVPVMKQRLRQCPSYVFSGLFWTMQAQAHSKELNYATPLEGHLSRRILPLPGPGFVHFQLFCPGDCRGYNDQSADH